MKLKLPDDMTIAAGSAIKAALSRALAANERVDLDAVDVRAIDLAGVQLLVAAQRSAARAGLELTFAVRSDVIDRAAAVLGFVKPAGDEPGWLWQEALDV